MITKKGVWGWCPRWVQGRVFVEGLGGGVAEYATKRPIINFEEMFLKIPNLSLGMHVHTRA